MIEEKFYPFHCGTQDVDWQSSNCWRCKKSWSNNDRAFKCDIDEALTRAALSDGSVSKEIAERMGSIKNRGYYNWECPEVEWTEEWKEKCRKKVS